LIIRNLQRTLKLLAPQKRAVDSVKEQEPSGKRTEAFRYKNQSPCIREPQPYTKGIPYIS